MQPFRFAVQVSNASSGAAWRALARKTEDLGYSTLFMPDHLGEQWAPLIAMTVAAEATTTLRVGTLVLDNDFRHPVILAKEAATLDLLSEGRLELGLGAGWMRDDYDQSGIAYDAPATRVDRLREAIAVLKDMWTDRAAATSRVTTTPWRGARLIRPRTADPIRCCWWVGAAARFSVWPDAKPTSWG